MTERSAGRELDLEIAERVMGEVVAHAPCGDGLTRTRESYGATLAECDADLRKGYAKAIADGMPFWAAEFVGPEYSTDIASAFLVVEATARERDWRWQMAVVRDPKMVDGLGAHVTIYTERPLSMQYANTLPLVICLAALRALDASTPSGAVEPPPSPEKQ